MLLNYKYDIFLIFLLLHQEWSLSSSWGIQWSAPAGVSFSSAPSVACHFKRSQVACSLVTIPVSQYHFYSLSVISVIS